MLSAKTLLGEDPAAPILERITTLLSEAAAIDGDHAEVLLASAHLLRLQQRWPELITVLNRLIDMYPTHAEGHERLGFSKIRSGAAEEGIQLLHTALQLDPRNPLAYNIYLNLGFGLLLLGRYEASIQCHQGNLAANPGVPIWLQAWTWNQMASAYALNGQLSEARSALAEAIRLDPHDTVRSHYPEVRDPTYMAQIERYREGLRLAGLRDHAKEDVDFGVPSDGQLRATLRGFTPLTARGAGTVLTAELVSLLATQKPLVLDTVTNFWGFSIPGAIGLRGAGVGGDDHDSVQARLSATVQALTRGERGSPIVTAGWNAERFDGYNLALRLVALGYRRVRWYRGGREAWEAAGLPVTELAIQSW